ncbi:MAG: GNAT family N-acetyltransferase [Anaerolineales bacterium]|nr:GNAT family N-acetyltransferase [Anaerolineales bacterium]
MAIEAVERESIVGKTLIASAFATTDIEAIYGMVKPQNKASVRVMEKINMTCLGLQVFRSEQDLFDRIDSTSLLDPPS